MTWLKNHPWVISIIIVVVVAVPGYIRMQTIADDNTQLVTCVKDWGKKQSDRTTALSGASADRFDALSQILAAVQTNDDAALTKAAKAYQQGDAAYKAIGKAHPAPEMNC